jgi:hypothetical protein
VKDTQQTFGRREEGTGETPPTNNNPNNQVHPYNNNNNPNTIYLIIATKNGELISFFSF